MNLVELHNVMGERIKITLDTTLTQEQREIENEQTKIIIGAAKQLNRD